MIARDEQSALDERQVLGREHTKCAGVDRSLDIDGNDFLRWQRGLGTTTGATLAQGNADGDTDVDGADLAIWKQQFSSGSQPGGASGVPEPLGLNLIGAGLFGAWLAGRAAARARVEMR